MSENNHNYNSKPQPDPTYTQQSLFDSIEQSQLKRTVRDSGATYVMGSTYLQNWKQAIAKYQHSITTTVPSQQADLFNLPQTHCDLEQINPFNLPIQPVEFYRLPSHDKGDACIYFVLDLLATEHMPAILYIGETCHSQQRWKGVHDCKRYLSNYREQNQAHHILTQLVMTFWWHTPADTKPRQQLERALIGRWRSPFNKENWHFWGNPFMH